MWKDKDSFAIVFITLYNILELISCCYWQAFLAIVKKEQEQAEKEREKEQEERRRKKRQRERMKRMLEAAFDGDTDEILTVLKEVGEI